MFSGYFFVLLGREIKTQSRIYYILKKRGVLLHKVLFSISEHLNIVRSRISSRLCSREGNIEDFVSLNYKVELEICSSLVLYSALNYGKITERVLSLAEVMQFFFLAIMVHDDINEENYSKFGNESLLNNSSQYPVLVGDYFFGWFFTTLCNAGMANYLKHISKTLCLINEKAIIRLKNQVEEAGNSTVGQASWHPEYAEIFGECCMLGGMEAEASKQQQQHLWDFGYALGMALGMSEKICCEHRKKIFNEALSKLECLCPGNSWADLRQFTYYLMKNGISDNKMVC